MKSWLRAVVSTPGALADAKEHLEALAKEQDSLSKAETLEGLYFQRGMVAGIRQVLFLLTSAK